MKGVEEMVFVPDVFVAMVFITAMCAGVFGYFKGAKDQLQECLKYRHCAWMDDERWKRHTDISVKTKWFPRSH